ncbi:MAG: MATE family efflux transporter [Bacteroidota bacterium]
MNKTILRLAIPNILSNLSIPLLGMVDTALMGHMDSPLFLGAVGIGGTIFNFLYWGLGFLRMGTTGLAAHAFGEGDKKKQNLILTHALMVAVFAALVFIIFQSAIGRFAFSFFPEQGNLLHYAELYFFVRIWAAPATISLYAFNGWFLGLQNARYPLIISVLGNLANIGFSVWFVIGMEWGIEGVAWATVLSQYISLLIALGLFFLSYAKEFQWPSFQELWDLESLKRFFSVNGDIFIRTLCLIFVFAVFTVESASFGAIILASNQVLRQFLDLMAYGVDGFAFAAESLVGRFMGEKQQEKLKSSLKGLFQWGIGLGLIFSLIYLVAGEYMISFFTDQPEVISTALTYLPWQFVIPLLASLAFMLDGVFLGATASAPMRNMMLISTFVFFLPALYFGKEVFGNHALWLSMTLFMLARAVSLWINLPRYIKVEEN